jgi:diguanylate cyclase (GGDEF)-like protein
MEKEVEEIEDILEKYKGKTLAKFLKRLYFYATRDHLTGLWNRRMLEDVLGKEVMKALRYKLPLSIMIIDIDDFKKYNDTYGHLQGDEAIKHVTKIILKNIRKADFAARYGGEEFVVVLPNTKKENAKIVAERIRKEVENTKIKKVSLELPEDCEKITVSIGVAELKNNINETLRDADSALLEAKRKGKNVVVVK